MEEAVGSGRAITAREDGDNRSCAVVVVGRIGAGLELLGVALAVVVGVGGGVVIAIIAFVPWSELPRRLAAALIAHWRRLRLIGLGAVFAAVLFYF